MIRLRHNKKGSFYLFPSFLSYSTTDKFDCFDSSVPAPQKAGMENPARNHPVWTLHCHNNRVDLLSRFHSPQLACKLILERNLALTTGGQLIAALFSRFHKTSIFTNVASERLLLERDPDHSSWYWVWLFPQTQMVEVVFLGSAYRPRPGGNPASGQACAGNLLPHRGYQRCDHQCTWCNRRIWPFLDPKKAS
jgi:hypothetical protein